MEGAFWSDDYQNSEFVFANLFVWSKNDQLEIMWGDGYAIARCLTSSRRVYLPPIAATESLFRQGLAAIRKAEAVPVIVGITPAMLPLFDDEDMLVLYDDVLAEYIYDPTALATLAGSKYHKKRNLFNQFTKKYAYQLTDYKPSDAKDVQDFLERHRLQGGNTDDYPPLQSALEHLDELGLFCDLLWVENRIVALSVGLISRYGHGIILFEKAEYDAIGAYAAINALTAGKHFQGIKYLSRQDDYGSPALRKAKLSYHPLARSAKHACIISREYRQMHDLYREAFDDSDRYVDHFFLYQSDPAKVVAAKANGKVASGLHLLERPMHFNGSLWPSAFIVGAATRPSFRRQGLMRQVISATLARCHREGYSLITLSPVAKEYYEPYGFVPYAFARRLDTDGVPVPCSLQETVDPRSLMELYDRETVGRCGYMVRNESRWIEYMNALAQDRVSFYLIMRDKQKVGYLATSGEEADELCLKEEILPLVEGYDFSRMMTPAVAGTIPTGMVRIVDIRKFLNAYAPPEEVFVDVAIKFTDPLLAANNVSLRLVAREGKLTITETSDHDFMMSVEDLTKTIFTKDKHEALDELFPNRCFICYDRF